MNLNWVDLSSVQFTSVICPFWFFGLTREIRPLFSFIFLVVGFICQIGPSFSIFIISLRTRILQSRSYGPPRVSALLFRVTYVKLLYLGPTLSRRRRRLLNWATTVMHKTHLGTIENSTILICLEYGLLPWFVLIGFLVWHVRSVHYSHYVIIFFGLAD